LFSIPPGIDLFRPAMHSIAAYVIAAGVGIVLAHFISRAPELRTMRLSQLLLVPLAMVWCTYFLPVPGESSGASLGKFPGFLFGLFVLIVLLAPNLGHHCGAILSNFLFSGDWTPAEEELALRPIRRLIDKDQFNQALIELDGLLKKRKPNYEALFLRAKLLHHFGNVNATVTALLEMIPLSHTTDQQLAAMDLLRELEEYHQEPPRAPAAGNRRIQIEHELVLFPTGAETASPHKAIPPGSYQITEFIRGNHRWLKLAGEDWGNAEMCWNAVVPANRLPGATRGNRLWEPIARMHRAITSAITPVSARHQKAESQRLLAEANQCIRRGDWQSAVPILQKAAACDPHRYEIAYRWAQAVRQTETVDAAAEVVSQVLQQSQWTESEQHMLEQLKGRQ
jgi:thioredoxin-like negative regulator of GroEL